MAISRTWWMLEVVHHILQSVQTLDLECHVMDQVRAEQWSTTFQLLQVDMVTVSMSCNAETFHISKPNHKESIE